MIVSLSLLDTGGIFLLFDEIQPVKVSTKAKRKKLHQSLVLGPDIELS